jgi:NAD(P)-dependent dehydrogenase (short-subunit alcohol dehydrogenase family)
MWTGKLDSELFVHRFFVKSTLYKKDTKIDGKIAIVTGGNSGIGKETAVDLAKRGGKVYIACRDIKRGEDALKEIKERSNSDNVHFLQLDLASLDSVREFSRKFHEVEDQLHILVNNAGIMACPKGKTKDGFELQLGTNHLGHFLLTNLLLDLLKSASPSRVIVVSALAHKWGSLNKDDLMGENSYNRFKAYIQSKLANNLFTHELAKKLQGTGVTANCLHPGIIVTNIIQHLSSNETVKSYLEPVFKQILNTPKEGAQTSICLAVDPDLAEVSGKYFVDCKEAKASADSTNDELAEWLWKKSEELVGMSVV